MRKTSGMAAAYNNHFQSKAIRAAIDNIKMLKRVLDASVEV
jgi:hypothetical protein